MNTITKIGIAVVIAAVTLTGCGSSDYDEREAQQNTVTLDDSLGIQAQTERLQREENANSVRYVYLMSFGQIVGYYVITGGVYDASTQLAAEQEIICRYSTSSDSCQAVDSARDNGTYGGDDGGVFFFTSDGTLVETSLDYVQSDQPLPIDTPRLGGSGG